MAIDLVNILPSLMTDVDDTYTLNGLFKEEEDHKDPSQQPKNVVLMGWCMPSSCTPYDLKTYLNSYFNTMDFSLRSHNVSYSSFIEDKNCQREDEYNDLDQTDISFGLVCVIILSLVISSTIYDCFRNYSNEKLVARSPIASLFLTFSIKKNLKKLPHADDSNPALTILYGMRVICILMIITDHRFGTHLSSAVLNFELVEEQYRSPVGTIFFHGDVFVDSFFILSGLLVTYCLLVQYDKRFINPGLIVFMRYIRLTPVYAIVIFYYATLFKYVGSGPMWKTIINAEVNDCRENWWTNILYISNYVNPEKMCMVHSWYLPCDFHYFMIAVILCIVIYKNKKVGLILLSFVTMAAIITPFAIVWYYQKSAVLFFYPDFLRQPKQQEDFLLTYSKSHTRASPYFIGMIAGYLYYRMRGSEKCLKKEYSHIILLSSLTVMIGSIVSGVIFYDPKYDYNAIESGLYASLHRVAWSAGSVGVLYVASYGHAKLIYNFLSWKPWVPISKLVYGAYLTHMQFQIRATARKGGSDFITYFDIISWAFSDIVLAFSSAFVLYLTVEAPFRNIFSLIFAPPARNTLKPKPKPVESQESVNEVTCDSHL
ncbi:nose resistant to fluoxetine protein 6-like [Diabrotica virgifera virgifera]|uniref:Acyltransferase 3 domain-containing protein n=2 Tax=Diabrotica virgifera virgifera TaxID=50390 RepID=A0ABM5JSM1_DIAVI|nr:nose resistant to fluoxetine protein 6-like [Diabrotica virgifera virgifera]